MFQIPPKKGSYIYGDMIASRMLIRDEIYPLTLSVSMAIPHSNGLNHHFHHKMAAGIPHIN
jgi:hypothetical protein